ncbi:MAG: ribonuclease HII [Roseobacter sp.]
MGPSFDMEREAMAAGVLRVAGVDEVGRGPLAGPVTAAAVILNPEQIPEGLNDSKQLSIKRRIALAEILVDCATVSVGHASVEEIEQHNILRASHFAMQRAIAGLPIQPDLVLIDGSMIPRGLNLPAQPVVKGDTRCLSISAASIVAKIARDRIMVDLAQQHPGYGWETNMGYGSKSHISALQNLGVTPHHRRTFKPVHNMLYQGEIVKP